MSQNLQLNIEKKARGIVINNVGDKDILIRRVIIYYRYTVATKRGIGIISSGTSYASKTGKEVHDINKNISSGEDIFIDFSPTDSIVKVEVIAEASGSRATIARSF